MSGFPLTLVSLLSFGLLGSAVAAAPRPRYYSGSNRPKLNHKANAQKKRKRKLAEQSRRRNRH